MSSYKYNSKQPILNDTVKPAFKPAMIVSLALFATLALGAGATPARATQPDLWQGRVTYVSDGDTIRVRPIKGGKPVSVRMEGIDAPEICQTGGTAARDALRARVMRRQVEVDAKASDDYGRVIAQIRLDGDDLGAWMVREGHAWSYRYRGQPGPYVVQQRIAIKAARGVFSEAGAVYPGEFRKQHGPCLR